MLGNHSKWEEVGVGKLRSQDTSGLRDSFLSASEERVLVGGKVLCGVGDGKGRVLLGADYERGNLQT